MTLGPVTGQKVPNAVSWRCVCVANISTLCPHDLLMVTATHFIENSVTFFAPDVNTEWMFAKCEGGMLTCCNAYPHNP